MSTYVGRKQTYTILRTIKQIYVYDTSNYKANICTNLFWNQLNCWFPYETTGNKEKHQNHDRKTVHGTTGCWCFFFAGEISTARPFILHHAFFQKFLYKSRPYKKSSSCGYSSWTRTDGIITSLRFSTTTGRERTVPGRAPPHTPLFELRTRTYFSLE